MLTLDTKMRKATSGGALVAASVLLSLIAGAALIYALGSNPVEVYRYLFWGAFGTGPNLVRTLRWATPLILSGLAVATAYKAGLLNMGGEGQIYAGAFAAALAGTLVSLPRPLHLPLALLVSAAAGGLFALIPALLRVYLGTNEIVTTLMFNYVGVLLTEYLVMAVFYPAGSLTKLVEVATPDIAPTAVLPKLVPPHELNAGLYIALGLALAIYWLYKRTTLGYQMEIGGANPEFARYAGLPVRRVALFSFILSGLIAGVAGGIETLGANGRFVSRFSTGLGFDGILVALLGQAHPIGVIFAGFLLGALKNGSFVVERATDMNRNVAVIIQGVIILLMSSPHLLKLAVKRRKGGIR
jgi:ABC-type uncharacterized transport system permease subunit